MASITRRTLLGSVGSTALGVALSGNVEAQQAAPPNIVFILADDFGYADASCYGSRNNRTPNIDRIGSEGVRFLQAYANSSVCSATRTALITGRYQYRLRVGLEEPLNQSPNIGLPPDMPTMPSLLKKAGYQTALIGKWHLGELPNFGPLKSGYDHFYGFRSGAVDYYAHIGTDGKKDLWDGDVPVDQTGYLTELLGNRVEKVIGDFAKAKKPFFISLHFNAPHWPWERPDDPASAERFAKGAPIYHYDGGSLDIYRSMVDALDKQVGRVLSTLEANGIADNTIVVFTSDNGGERFSDTWPFSGKKTDLLEGGLRIPAVIRWPARIKGGRTHDQTMISMDWMPTFLAAAGSAPDPAYPSDGMSLLPALIDNAAPVPRKLYWRYKANGQRAMRDGNMKILKELDNTFLFNVVEDQLERANLKNLHRDVYDRMVGEWNAWNSTMLPENADARSSGIIGKNTADRVGVKPWPGAPDTSEWPK